MIRSELDDEYPAGPQESVHRNCEQTVVPHIAAEIMSSSKPSPFEFLDVGEHFIANDCSSPTTMTKRPSQSALGGLLRLCASNCVCE